MSPPLSNLRDLMKPVAPIAVADTDIDAQPGGI